MRGRGLAAALAIGLVLRLAFGLGYWRDKPLTLDEQEYLLLAHNLAEGRGFSYVSPASGQVEGRHVGRAPLYPLFLAGLGWAVPGSAIRAAALPTSVPAEIKIAQALLGCLLIALVARWTTRLLGGSPRAESAGVAAALVAAVYPPLVWIGAYVLSETLYAVLAFGVAWLIDRAAASAGRPSIALASAAGLLAGAATLTRPAILLFLVLVAGWWLVARRLSPLVALTLGAILVVAPWTARNYREYGRMVLVASEGGVTFWTGNNRMATGEGDLAANAGMKAAALAIERSVPGATPEALEPVFYREAFADIREDPARWAGLLARKAFYTVVPMGPSYRLHSPLFVAASVIPYLLVLPFAVLGAWRLRTSPSPAVALWLLAASSVLVCLVFFPQERFRVPIVDPVLIICAATILPAAPAWLLAAEGRR